MKQATLLLSLLFTATVAWGTHLAISTTGMTGGARTNKPVRLTLTDTNYVVSGQFIGMEPVTTNTDYAGACIISNFVGGHCLLTIGGNPPATWMLSVPITNGLVDAATCTTNRAGLSYSPWSDLRYLSQPGGSNLVTWTNGGRVYIAGTVSGTELASLPVLLSNLVTNPNPTWTNTLVQGANVTLATNANGTVTITASIFGGYASLEDATNIVRALALLTAGNRGTNVILLNSTNLGTMTMATRPGLSTNAPLVLDGDGTVISTSWPVVTATNAIANLNGKGTNTSFWGDLFPYGGITFPETGTPRLDTVMGVPLDLPPGFITQRGFITNGLYVGGDETNVGNMYLQGTLTGSDGNLKLGLPGHIVTFGGLPVFGSTFTSVLLPDAATNNLGASKRLKSSSNVTLTTNASDLVVDLASNIDLGTLTVGALTVSNVSTNKPLIFGGDSNLTSVDWPTVGTTLNVSNNITASNLWDRSNLKWWGAAGDGVTDDSHAISNWLAYIRQGITGYVPRGKYRTSAQDCTTASSLDEADPNALFGPHASYHIVGESLPSYPHFSPANVVMTNAVFVGFEDGPPIFDFTGCKGVKLENLAFNTEGTNMPECAILMGRHGLYDGSAGMQEFDWCSFWGEYRIASQIGVAVDGVKFHKCVWNVGLVNQQVGIYFAFQTNLMVALNGVTNCVTSKFRPFTGVMMGGMQMNIWDECYWNNYSTHQGISMVLETAGGIVQNGSCGVTGGSTNNFILAYSSTMTFEHTSIEGWGANPVPNFVEFTASGIHIEPTFRSCSPISIIYSGGNSYVNGLRIENCTWYQGVTNLNLSHLRNGYVQGGGYPQGGSGYFASTSTNVGIWCVRDVAENNTWVGVWPTNVVGVRQESGTFFTPTAALQNESVNSKQVYSTRAIGTTPYMETPISAELVSNGSMATTNGWATFAGLGNTIESVSGGVAGNCLLVTNGVIAQAGSAEQALATVAGHSYKLSFYGKREDTNTYGWAVNVGTAEGLTDLLCGAIHNETSWTAVSGVFDATSSQSWVSLRVYDTNAIAHAYFDSVSVVEIPSGNISARGLFTGPGGTNGVKVTSAGYMAIGTNDAAFPLSVVQNGVAVDDTKPAVQVRGDNDALVQIDRGDSSRIGGLLFTTVGLGKWFAGNYYRAGANNNFGIGTGPLEANQCLVVSNDGVIFGNGAGFSNITVAGGGTGTNNSTATAGQGLYYNAAAGVFMASNNPTGGGGDAGGTNARAYSLNGSLTNATLYQLFHAVGPVAADSKSYLAQIENPMKLANDGGTNTIIVNTNSGIGFSTEPMTPYTLTVPSCYFGSADDGIKEVVQSCSDTMGWHTGIGFKVTGTTGDQAIKGGILFERKGTYSVGNMHFAINNTNDSSNVTLGDAKATLFTNGDMTVTGTLTVPQIVATNGNVITLSNNLISLATTTANNVSNFVNAVSNKFDLLVRTTNIWSTALSNIVVDADAKELRIFATNSFTLTNFANLEAGYGTTVKYVTVSVLGCNATAPTITWPTLGGNSYSVRIWTNANSPVFTTVTNATCNTYSIRCCGTNLDIACSVWQ